MIAVITFEIFKYVTLEDAFFVNKLIKIFKIIYLKIILHLLYYLFMYVCM